MDGGFISIFQEGPCAKPAREGVWRSLGHPIMRGRTRSKHMLMNRYRTVVARSRSNGSKPIPRRGAHNLISRVRDRINGQKPVPFLQPWTTAAVTPQVFIFRSTTSTDLSTWYHWIRQTLRSNYLRLSWFYRIRFICRECDVVFIFIYPGLSSVFVMFGTSCTENRCVRWLFKIHRPCEYEFRSPTHSNDFIHNKLICTRRLRFLVQTIRLTLVNREIVYEDPKIVHQFTDKLSWLWNQVFRG
jgi:hypothetical protein